MQLTEGILLQMALMGACTYLKCEPEPGDTSTKALVATLRKQLSLARNHVPPFIRKFQVRMGTMPRSLPALSGKVYTGSNVNPLISAVH